VAEELSDDDTSVQFDKLLEKRKRELYSACPHSEEKHIVPFLKQLASYQPQPSSPHLRRPRSCSGGEGISGFPRERLTWSNRVKRERMTDTHQVVDCLRLENRSGRISFFR